MEAAFRHQAERREFINRSFEGRAPSLEHYQLGTLLSNRTFKDALTTNFDHLLEIATSQVSGEPVFVYPTQKALEGLQSFQGSPRIIKLHGDFLFQSLANTDAEMGGVGTASMYQALRDLTVDTSLVVIGYAGDHSILKMLEELAIRFERCIPSVWWFFHNPLGLDLEQDSSKSTEYERVADFLRKLERVGRRTTLLRNVYGIKWVFEELSKNIDLDVAKPAFGIGSNRYLGPIRASDVKSTYESGSPQTLLPQIGELQTRLSKPGLILIGGRTRSGKSSLLKTLAFKSERPVFYFSFVHARNSPEDHAFLVSLHDFLRRRRILSQAKEDEFWLETLFQVDGIVALDDLPVTFTSGRRTPDFGPLRRSSLHILLPALQLIAETRRGNVILAVPDALVDPYRNSLYQVLNSIAGLNISEMNIDTEEQPVRLKDYRRLERPLKAVVNNMLWLRFAEPPEVIAKLSKTDRPVIDELSELVAAGFVSESFGTYILRLEFRNLLTRHLLNTWSTQDLESSLRHLIDVFKEEAEDPEQLNSRHYLLEVENACFASAADFGTTLWQTGVRTLATMTRAFLSDRLNVEFFLSTLSGFHQLVGKRVFKICDLLDLMSLYVLFSSPSHTDKFPDLTEEFWRELRRRGPALGLFLSGRKSLENSGYLDKLAVVKLLRAVSRLHRDVVPSDATPDDWVLLGSMHLAIAKAATHQLGQGISKRAMFRADRHAHAAHHCFTRSDKQDFIDDAERLLGNIYMMMGQYQIAKRYFIPLLRRERNLPGFEPAKAASLHNAFCISLGLGDLPRAEGYFWEANYQYVHTTTWMSILALVVLASTKASPLPFIPIAGLPELLDQLPSASFIAEKIASTAPIAARGISEELLLRATGMLGQVAGSLCEKGQIGEAGAVVKSTLTMLDEALPVGSRSFNDGVVSELVESLKRHLIPNIESLIPIAFIKGLSSIELKTRLQNHC
jgi:SIR2-like domain